MIRFTTCLLIATVCTTAGAGDFTVRPDHPRLFITSDNRADLIKRIAAAPAIWKEVVACADGKPDKTGDRLICTAALYRLGLAPGFKYNQTSEGYGAQAVGDLLDLPITMGQSGSLEFTLAPLACGYDWLHNLLTPEQRSSMLTKIQKVMDGRSDPNTSYAWASYNHISGSGMILALATHGETSKDFVQDYYHNNWWKPKDRKLHNWWYVRNNLEGGGNREGFGYYQFAYVNWLDKAAWETATDNRELAKLGWFTRFPYWVLFQTDPKLKNGSFLWSLPTITYSGAQEWARMWYEMLAASTTFSDDKGKALARWLLDSTVGYGAARGPARALLFGLLIGDPRIKGKSPAELRLPLEHVVQPYGEVFERSDWSPDATVVYFGCCTHLSRSYPLNNMMLWSKGQPLLANRQILYSHSYGPCWLRNGVVFFRGNELAFDVTFEGDPDYAERGSLSRSGEKWIGNGTRAYSDPPPHKVDATKYLQLARRTFEYDRKKNSITVLDELECDKSLSPHITWNMPTEPKVEGRTISIMNGPAACVLTMDAEPARIIKIGGPDHLIDDLKGKPFTTASQQLDNTWIKLPETDKIRQGGFWRVHVVPAGSGKFRLQTVIDVK